MAKTFSTHGVILKRTSVGEYDRVITILTQEFGKYSCVAKGVRKLNSSKGALLEPGNYVKAFFVQTKSMPLLTQAVLLDGSAQLSHSLTAYRSLYQVLEIFEKLFVEEALDEYVFNQVLDLRRTVVSERIAAPKIREKLGALIESLGFQHPDESDHETITDYLQALLAQPLRSYGFLKV